jgi:hypothetical protein
VSKKNKRARREVVADYINWFKECSGPYKSNID